ncbi:hypothetical protein ABN028_07455 [Actinopolymorpha sp. B17G11]|uniref:hypothetical protein n=1 Tax=unclassified Actinopolymorpha TaxID=2627063 RepID=UPI0032D90ED9
MSDVTAPPVNGEVFLDARGDERSLRVSWYEQSSHDGTVVLSIWREAICVVSFRLEGREVPILIEALARASDLFPSSAARPQVPEQAGSADNA